MNKVELDDMFAPDPDPNTAKAQFVPKPFYSLDYKYSLPNVKHYLVFFLFHLIYFNVLGPFIALFFLFTQKSRQLIHNMQIVRLTWICLWNTVPWLCNLTIIIYIVAAKKSDEPIYPVIIYNIIMINFLRCSVVASKYSTLGYGKIKQMINRILPLQEMNGEHMLFAWQQQTPDQIFRNINMVMARFEFDDSNMMVSFMKNPTEETIKIIEKAEILEAEFNQVLKGRMDLRTQEFSKQVELFQYDGEKKRFTLTSQQKYTVTIRKGNNKKTQTIRYFRVKPILFHLIQESNKGFLHILAPWISIILGVCRGYLPIIIYLEKLEPFPGDDGLEKFVLFVLNFTLSYSYYYLARFIFQAVIDFNRKIYLMQELHSMITPHKFYAKKKYPTINFLDPTSAYGWNKMRRIAKCYGQTMINRHELLLAALLIYMIFVYLANWTVELGLVKFEDSFINSLVPFLRIDYMVFSSMVLVILIIISNINSYFESHIKSLQHIRDYLDQVMFFQRHYFKTGEDKVDLFRLQRDLVYDKEPTDDVVKALIKALKDICPADQYSPYLKNLYKAWNLMATNLEKEKLVDKIQVLSFKVESNIVVRFFTLVLFSTLATLKFWLEPDQNSGSSTPTSPIDPTGGIRRIRILFDLFSN